MNVTDIATGNQFILSDDEIQIMIAALKTVSAINQSTVEMGGHYSKETIDNAVNKINKINKILVKLNSQ